MKDLIKEYENLIYGIGFIIMGFSALIFMKIQKSKETEEERQEEYKYSMSKSVRFGIYLGGALGVIIGVLIILGELLS